MSSISENLSWSDKLSAITYDDESRDLVRYRVSESDDQVASIVRGVLVSGAHEDRKFRQQMTADNIETLLQYASRRTVQLRRSASLGLVDEIMNTYGVFFHERDVPWDSWFKGALFEARALGLDLNEVQRQFNEVAPIEITERADIAFRAMDRVEVLGQCQLAETNTTYGIGFLKLLVFHFVRRRFSTGIIADRDVDFEPITNIAQVTVDLADAMDATDLVKTGPLAQDQLAGSMFDMVVPGSYVESLGCVSFIASGNENEDSFSVFVAEFDPETNVEELAAAATALGNQAAVYDATRLVLISAQPSFEELTNEDGDDEDDEPDFHNFEELARAALGSPAPQSVSAPLTFGGLS